MQPLFRMGTVTLGKATAATSVRPTRARVGRNRLAASRVSSTHGKPVRRSVAAADGSAWGIESPVPFEEGPDQSSAAAVVGGHG